MRIRTANALVTVLYLGLALAGGLAFQRFDRERGAEAEAYRRRIRATDEVVHFLAGSQQLTSSVQSFVATGDPTFAEAYRRELELTRSRDRAAEAIAGLGLTPEEQNLMRRARASSDALVTVEARAITVAQSGDRTRAVQLVFGPAYQRALRDIHEPSLTLQRLLERRLQEALEQSGARAAHWWRLSLALAGLNLLLVVSVLVVLYPRFLARPLLRLNQRVQALLANQRPAPQDLGHAATDLRELARSLEAYEAMADELERDHWVKSEQVQITAALQRFHDPAALATCFLARLAPLLGIASATFYLRERGAERLRLVGSYALADPARVPALIRFGEGLVGEAARQGQPIRQDDPSAGRLPIVSGTGGTRPAQVLVLPVGGADQLLAVVELAVLHPLAPHQQTLLSDLLPLLSLALEALPAAALS